MEGSQVIYPIPDLPIHQKPILKDLSSVAPGEITGIPEELLDTFVRALQKGTEEDSS